MKNKKIKTIVKILLVMLIVFISIIAISKSYAGSFSASGLENIYNSKDSTINSIGGKIIWVVQLICNSAAVLIIMIKGVQFMMASPTGKAEIKKSMITWMIGGLLLFAVGALVKFIGNIALNSIK